MQQKEIVLRWFADTIFLDFPRIFLIKKNFRHDKLDQSLPRLYTTKHPCYRQFQKQTHRTLYLTDLIIEAN